MYIYPQFNSGWLPVFHSSSEYTYIYMYIPNSQGWACGPSAFFSEFYSYSEGWFNVPEYLIEMIPTFTQSGLG